VGDADGGVAGSARAVSVGRSRQARNEALGVLEGSLPVGVAERSVVASHALGERIIAASGADIGEGGRARRRGGGVAVARGLDVAGVGGDLGRSARDIATASRGAATTAAASQDRSLGNRGSADPVRGVSEEDTILEAPLVEAQSGPSSNAAAGRAGVSASSRHRAGRARAASIDVGRESVGSGVVARLAGRVDHFIASGRGG